MSYIKHVLIQHMLYITPLDPKSFPEDIHYPDLFTGGECAAWNGGLPGHLQSSFRQNGSGDGHAAPTKIFDPLHRACLGPRVKICALLWRSGPPQLSDPTLRGFNVGPVARPLVDQLPRGAVRHPCSVGEELVNGIFDVEVGEEVDHVQLVPVRVGGAAVLARLGTRPTDTDSSNVFDHCARLADLRSSSRYRFDN
jgi:hypothetical protein